MVHLPPAFTDYTSALFGAERWARFLQAFDEPAPVSVRLNPWKQETQIPFSNAQAVPWCKDGYWLETRPDFTRDPLFHAGVYYVQEAGSLFLDHVARQVITKPVAALDLCAAPGGKATLLRGALPQGSVLVCNETDRRRANILLENMLKQGHPDVLVTHNHAGDFQKAGFCFDVILADVPCSGEGLFRREPDAVNEWSVSNVHFCQQRQRQIVQAIWPCLRAGGIFIYSTCTFNTHENEENVRFMVEELGAEVVSVQTQAEWNITGSLLANWNGAVYRFIPGITKSEGFFLAVLRKKGDSFAPAFLPSSVRKQAAKNRLIHLLADGNPQAQPKGKEFVPTAAQALSLSLPRALYPQVELTLEQAQRYLHRESFALPDGTPNGFVVVMFHHHPLGFMKNVGARANNLYPKNWAIRTL